MKKKLFVLLTLIIVLGAVSIPALATPSTDVAGDWYYHPRLGELEVRLAGGNTIFSTVEDSRFNGTFHGSEDCVAIEEKNCVASVDYGTVIIHPSGRANFQGWVLFPALTLDGHTGSLEMQVNGTLPSIGTSEWDGRWTITGGELHQAGLRGQGIWWGPGWQEVPGVWGEIHYSGNIHFESD